jgi:carbonic anhydrase/acetyltransferase-like protein (isoleucine patch superfamily)
MSNCYAIKDLIPVVDPTAYVHPTAMLIGDVIIGPRCYVGPAARLRVLRTLCRVQHVTGDGRMRIIVYLMMRSDPR